MADEERMQVYDPNAELQSDLEKMKLERQRKNRSEQFDKRLVDLANKAVDFRIKYGDEHYLTELMVTFLDVALQLKEVIEVLAAVNVAMECLSDAIGFIDAAISFDEQLFKESTEQKYGFFARMRRRRLAKRAMRNNVGRMKSMVQGLMDKYKMAIGITTSLKNSCAKMQKVMSSKSMANKKGKAAGGASFGTPVAAKSMIDQVMKERGLSEEQVGSGSSDGTKADDTTSKDGGIGSIDDIV